MDNRRIKMWQADKTGKYKKLWSDLSDNNGKYKYSNAYLARGFSKSSDEFYPCHMNNNYRDCPSLRRSQR